jgi:uncharacterized membrane protein YeaQ/YmgE (transglycosylase-associated protein family)
MERLAIPTRGETSRIPSGARHWLVWLPWARRPSPPRFTPSGRCFGADIVIGVAGAFVGNWLLPQLGIHFGAGLVAAIINATIGALILLVFISRALRRL